MEPIIPKAIEDYCAEHSAPASALRAELEEYTRRDVAHPQMLTGSLEAALLQTLVRVSGAHHVLEIGLYTGYSALAMAEALPEDGRLVSCEISAENARTAQSFIARSPHAGKIRIELGPALETIAQLPPEPPFDFVFLDADKENYLNYYEAVLPRLRTGGLIVADNVLWSGRVLEPRRETDRLIARFNDRVRTDARVECVMLPVRDGVSLIRKR
jgi:caffeoyl-CoA O-methyltransferase